MHFDFEILTAFISVDIKLYKKNNKAYLTFPNQVKW